MVRRWVVRVGVCGVVGVVVNVVVAWGFVRWGDDGGREATPPRAPFEVPGGWSEPEAVPASGNVGWDLTLWLCYEQSMQEAAQAEAARRQAELTPGEWPELPGVRRAVWWSFMTFHSRAGWPWRSMDGVLCESGFREGTEPSRSWTLARSEWVPEWIVSRRSWRDAFVPLRPMWPGFALNTLVYGVAAYGVVFAPVDVRRWRRGRGGRCVGCGYDLAGIARGMRCPECGG